MWAKYLGQIPRNKGRKEIFLSVRLCLSVVYLCITWRVNVSVRFCQSQLLWWLLKLMLNLALFLLLVFRYQFGKKLSLILDRAITCVGLWNLIPEKQTEEKNDKLQPTVTLTIWSKNAECFLYGNGFFFNVTSWLFSLMEDSIKVFIYFYFGFYLIVFYLDILSFRHSFIRLYN